MIFNFSKFWQSEVPSICKIWLSKKLSFPMIYGSITTGHRYKNLPPSQITQISLFLQIFSYFHQTSKIFQTVSFTAYMFLTLNFYILYAHSLILGELVLVAVQYTFGPKVPWFKIAFVPSNAIQLVDCFHLPLIIMKI